MTAAAGYSGTPLARKLGYGTGPVWAPDMPAEVRRLIERDGPQIWAEPETATDAHLFVTEYATLTTRLAQAMRCLPETGMIWVSWPKRASKRATDVTEDRIRDAALPLGLVDVKVCALDATWSGLKLVLRKENRTGAKTMAQSNTEAPNG
ncbi:DUF3052 family protein [Halovulum sp. GXIMD14794]